MNDFVLDPQLREDCFVLGKFGGSQLLLMNNALVPWFILVPETEEIEWFALDSDVQQSLLSEINALSDFVNVKCSPDTLNIAMIGNKVQQMHIHVVGRHHTDYCWPGVVWGASGGEPYNDDDVEEMRFEVARFFDSGLTPSEPST